MTPYVTEKLSSEPPHVHEVTLVDILTQLALRKRLIAGVTAGAGVLGVVLALVLPVRYTATTVLMPPQQTQSASSMLLSQMAGSPLSLAALAGSGLGMKNPDDIYVGLLKSRPVADDMIRKFHLAGLYHSRDMTAARKKLAGFTAVNSEKDGMISISVTDGDKQRATEMANAYVEELRGLTNHLAMTEASGRRLFYEQQLVGAKDALVAAELGFQQVQQNKGMVSLDAQSKAMIESLATLRGQIAAKQVQLEALRSYSTERNPDVELAQRELTAMEGEESRLEQRNHASQAGGMGLGDIPGVGRAYLTAQHELAYRQTLYDLLIKQYDAAKLDESKEAAVIQVVAPAIPPDRKSFPPRTLLILGAIAAGFIAACILALILRWLEVMGSNPDFAVRLKRLNSAIKTGQENPSW